MVLRRKARGALTAAAAGVIRRVKRTVLRCPLRAGASAAASRGPRGSAAGLPRGRRGADSRCLKLTSPLAGSAVKQAVAHAAWDWAPSDGAERWHGSCPCCKRPLEAELCEAAPAPEVSAAARGRFAYVINLWGRSSEYVLGALVLGHSIRKTGSKHALVCLHAPDVPAEFLNLLRRIWDCRQVEHVKVVNEKLAAGAFDPSHRFAKVFTKLRAMELVEFEKVLVMDIDLLVLSNIDELFELPAPAAMRRGMNESWYPLQHGDPIDGRHFFMGKDPSVWSWGQGTGINAGVMLWRPSLEVLSEMLSELTEPNHPEHCPGNGPEQDYLSRFWADAPWHHISVCYNYQLHHMFNGLHPDKAESAERMLLLRTPEKIKVLHFSGEDAAKPWQRVLATDPGVAFSWPDRRRDPEYSRSFAEEFNGYHVWVRRSREWLEDLKAASSHSWDLQDFSIREDGELYRHSERCAPPGEAVEAAMALMNGVLGSWFDTLEDLQRELGGLDLRRALPVGRKASSEGTPPPEAKKPAPAPWFAWARGPEGWWREEPRAASHAAAPAEASSFLRAVAVASGASSGRFVSIFEGGERTFELRDDRFAGLVMKVVGAPASAQSFALPAAGASEDPGLTGTLEAVRAWIRAVPVGAGVLVALVAVAPDVLVRVLQELAPLGMPALAPKQGSFSCALVAAGLRQPASSESGHSAAVPWSDTHASSDVAYVTVPMPRGSV